MELYIPPKTNPVNGQYYPGGKPFNRGLSWDKWMPEKHRERVKSYLQLARVKGNATIAGWNAKVVLMILNGKIIGSFKSCQEAGRKTGIQSRNINSVCNGKRKRAGGYEWIYESNLKKRI